ERGHRTFNELLIENEWKGLHFEYGGGQCEQFNTSEEERKTGKYVGELLEVVKGGSIEYSES
ncbi:MAG TPA: hypothetical protein VH025_07430, partial [Solirubrobacteraceae bacterium]|nr:hypothetical protein [Solirubrobacteraceae bacterium]